IGLRKFKIDNKNYVVIQIQEYSSIPVLCKKTGEFGLVIGHMYTRPRKKIESAIVPSQTDMREILELYLEKELSRIRRLAHLMPSSQPQTTKPSDQENFDRQLGGL